MNLVCDLDGVVYRGSRSIPGAGSALRRARERGDNLLFCTNNSSRTRSQVADKVQTVTGFAARTEEIVGSAEAAVSLLAGFTDLVFVLGGEGIFDELTRVGIASSDRAGQAVLVGLDTSLSYGRLRLAAQLVTAGSRFIATNDDATYPTDDGFWPGAGAIVAAVEVASGRKAEVAGKPHVPMRELIKQKLVPGPVWVIGDRPDTDLALAALEPDWKSVLVLTGVWDDPSTADPKPDLVAPDLAAALTLIPA